MGSVFGFLMEIAEKAVETVRSIQQFLRNDAPQIIKGIIIVVAFCLLPCGIILLATLL